MPTTRDAATDPRREAIFGLLALQMGLVTPEALAEALRARADDPSRTLGDLLAAGGALPDRAREAIEPLIGLHLRLQGDDPERSTAALSPLAAGLRPDATVTYRSEATASDPEAAGPSAPGAESGAGPAGGRFRLVRPHAEGGLGRIFVAIDEELGREVAVKEIRPDLADDPSSRARFLLEAAVTGAMEHPGLVPVYGLGRYADGRPYYAMRLIRGESLKEALGRLHAARAERRARGRRPRPLGPEIRPLLRRLLDVCDAIDYAHSRGVLHRDLKPANIMLGPFGETLVVDWGLAKPMGAAEAGGPEPALPASLGDTHETLPGRVVGTPAYMSPEQAAGDPTRLGPASDVYSLGATLYALLTGGSPFGDLRVVEVLRRVQRGEFPPPRAVAPGVPGALEAVCLKAMALDPADRYPTARAFAEDLERWLDDEPVAAWREPIAARLARWARRHKATALALLAALIGGLAATTWAAVGYRELASAERHGREKGLRVAAKFAARTVAGEIDRRWRILESEADDPELAALLDGGVGGGEGEGDALRDWLASRLDRYRGVVAATNWFLCDASGVQVARAPFSAASVGANFAYRDYFHGRGLDLPEATRGVGPIRRPHRSIVFRSQATRGYMVTFSVPVWSGREGSADRRVVGVLGMSVDLGRFGVLQLDLDARQVAVLVDARPDEDGRPGLILHHPELARFNRHDAPARHLDPAALARLDAARGPSLERKRRREAAPDGPAPPAPAGAAGSLLDGYRDPFDGPAAGPWLAAFEPVVVEGRPDPIDDTGWMVVVQERVQAR